MHTGQISFRGFIPTLRNFLKTCSFVLPCHVATLIRNVATLVVSIIHHVSVMLRRWTPRRDVNLDPLYHVATLDFHIATSIWTTLCHVAMSVWTPSGTSRHGFSCRDVGFISPLARRDVGFNFTTLDLLSLCHVATWSNVATLANKLSDTSRL